MDATLLLAPQCRRQGIIDKFEYDEVVYHLLSMGICGPLGCDLFSGICSWLSWCFQLWCLGCHVLNEERCTFHDR